jgi:hypothetical protein
MYRLFLFFSPLAYLPNKSRARGEFLTWIITQKSWFIRKSVPGVEESREFEGKQFQMTEACGLAFQMNQSSLSSQITQEFGQEPESNDFLC